MYIYTHAVSSEENIVVDAVAVGDKLVYCSKDATVTILANQQVVKQLSYSCPQHAEYYNVAKVFASHKSLAFFVDNSLRNTVVQVDLQQYGYPEEIVAIVSEGQILQLAVDHGKGTLVVLVESPSAVVVYDIANKRQLANRALDSGKCV